MAAARESKTLAVRLAEGNRTHGLEVLRDELAADIETARAEKRSTSALHGQLRLVLADLARLAPGQPAPGVTPPDPTGGKEHDGVADIAAARAARLAGADASARSTARPGRVKRR